MDVDIVARWRGWDMLDASGGSTRTGGLVCCVRSGVMSDRVLVIGRVRRRRFVARWWCIR